MITLKQGIKLSAIVDKMELKIGDPNASTSAVGSDLIMQFISKAHKAEKEVYELVADIKKISAEEAADIDLVDFIKELFGNQEMLSFFKSAAKSSVQES